MNLETALSFNGKKASDCSAEEIESLMKKGRSLGVNVSVINSAPQSELDLAVSKSQYDEIRNSYPSFVHVSQTIA